MTKEDTIKNNLTNEFSYLADKIRVQRERRIYLEANFNDFPEVFDYIIKQLKFPILCAITGLDEQDKISFIYHLAQEDGIVINLKTSVPRENPVIQTVTKYFSSAEIYEREMVDLLGIKVEGLSKGNRYPLPDNWPAGQYPLRKDWKATE
jgi:Ni,Fe-hydrogenase III component G